MFHFFILINQNDLLRNLLFKLSALSDCFDCFHFLKIYFRGSEESTQHNTSGVPMKSSF